MRIRSWVWGSGGGGCSAVPAFWGPSPPSLLVDQGVETDQGMAPDKILPSTPPKTKLLPQITAFFFSSHQFGIPSPAPCPGWARGGGRDPWQVLCCQNPPVPPPQPYPAGTGGTLGSQLCSASTRSRSSSFPPSFIPAKPLGKQESCCGPWSSSPALLDAAGGAAELCLHGLALEMRQDHDVSSLSGWFFLYFIFVFLHKKKINSTQGTPREQRGRRTQLAQRPQRGAAVETPQHSMLSVQSNPQDGGKKPKKIPFLLIDFTP